MFEIRTGDLPKAYVDRVKSGRLIVLPVLNIGRDCVRRISVLFSKDALDGRSFLCG